MYLSKRFVLLLVLPIVSLVSCDRDWFIMGEQSSINIPTIGNTNDSFGLNVQAKSFTYNRLFDVSFSSDSLVVGVVVVGYQSGSGKLEIKDEDVTFYSVTVNNNMVIGDVTLKGNVPKKISIVFTKFTGNVSVGVVAKQ